MTTIHGWGRYPKIDASIYSASSNLGAAKELAQTDAIVARGLGRSYGDSSLSANIFSTAALTHLLDFDEETGVVCCQAGVSLADLLTVFVPRGWFIPVTPGTRFVTVGGAIASDVHGKNHHLDGCFSVHVIDLKLMLATGDVITCSPNEHTDLFRATCGGMGLTGVILEARIQLRRISSAFIDETTLKAANVDQALTLFESSADSTYSVAWIDCLQRGSALGRSLIMLGEHAKRGELAVGKKNGLSLPLDMPSFLLNKYSIAAFNSLYFNRVRSPRQQRVVHYEPFFYPLDGIQHWNRLYGKKGFLQYQFVIPKAAGEKAMREILQRIARSGRGSFLAVLKVFGKQNENYLSFPYEGYTLALDFKLESGLFELLDELDRQVLDYGGRVYLTKDARMSEATFKQSYPQWERFQHVREQYGALHKFASLQSQRLGL